MSICVYFIYENDLFPFVANTYVHTVQSEGASVPQVLHFIGCEKPCALLSKSKYHTQDFVTLKSCEGLSVLN